MKREVPYEETTAVTTTRCVINGPDSLSLLRHAPSPLVPCTTYSFVVAIFFQIFLFGTKRYERESGTTFPSATDKNIEQMDSIVFRSWMVISPPTFPIVPSERVQETKDSV